MADATTTTGPKPGHAAGATTKGAVAGVGVGGSAATLIGYALVKTGFETDPETVVVLAGALVTLVGAVVAFFAGKLTPSDQGNPVFAQSAVEQIKAMVERFMFLQGSGPERFEDDGAPGRHEAETTTGDPVTGSTAASAAQAEDDARAILERRDQG